VSRRYSFPLRAGHRSAFMCTESTEYRYIEDLGAPKDWFKANVDNIIKVFGRQHGIHKEDLYLGKCV
jgi:abelson tyrosine-protein kinase 1